MEDEENLCRLFIANTSINPRTGGRLVFGKQPYNSYIELCRTYGYSLADDDEDFDYTEEEEEEETAEEEYKYEEPSSDPTTYYRQLSSRIYDSTYGKATNYNSYYEDTLYDNPMYNRQTIIESTRESAYKPTGPELLSFETTDYR